MAHAGSLEQRGLSYLSQYRNCLALYPGFMGSMESWFFQEDRAFAGSPPGQPVVGFPVHLWPFPALHGVGEYQRQYPLTVFIQVLA